VIPRPITATLERSAPLTLGESAVKGLTDRYDKTQTRECVHNGVAHRTKRLQGQSNPNAWEEPRDNCKHTHQKHNNPAQNKTKKIKT